MSSQTPRLLQPKQPEDDEQQPSATRDSPGAPDAKQTQMGEGRNEGSREYNRRTADDLRKAGVEADAQGARPKSEQDARAMQRAEDEGRSHSKGEH